MSMDLLGIYWMTFEAYLTVSSVVFGLYRTALVHLMEAGVGIEPASTALQAAA